MISSPPKKNNLKRQELPQCRKQTFCEMKTSPKKSHSAENTKRCSPSGSKDFFLSKSIKTGDSFGILKFFEKNTQIPFQSK